MVFGFGKKKVELRAPFAGELVALVDVPDQLFSEKMLGDGFAIRPAKDVEVVEVVAPCAGKLSRVFNTKHAFAMVSDEGLEILVHIGLETVELAGEGLVARLIQHEVGHLDGALYIDGLERSVKKRALRQIRETL